MTWTWWDYLDAACDEITDFILSAPWLWRD